MPKAILVLNCGSSSIKFALFDGETEPLRREPMWSGQIDGIGTAKVILTEAGSSPTPLTLDPRRPFETALQHVRDRVVLRTGGQPPAAVAHRVVHGGSKYGAPVRVNAAVLAD